MGAVLFLEKEAIMTGKKIIPENNDENLRDQWKTPDVPDRFREKGKAPPDQKPGGNKNVNDPALLPIGDPAGMA